MFFIYLPSPLAAAAAAGFIPSDTQTERTLRRAKEEGEAYSAAVESAAEVKVAQGAQQHAGGSGAHAADTPGATAGGSDEAKQKGVAEHEFKVCCTGVQLVLCPTPSWGHAAAACMSVKSKVVVTVRCGAAERGGQAGPTAAGRGGRGAVVRKTRRGGRWRHSGPSDG